MRNITIFCPFLLIDNSAVFVWIAVLPHNYYTDRDVPDIPQITFIDGGVCIVFVLWFGSDSSSENCWYNQTYPHFMYIMYSKKNVSKEGGTTVYQSCSSYDLCMTLYIMKFVICNIINIYNGTYTVECRYNASSWVYFVRIWVKINRVITA